MMSTRRVYFTTGVLLSALVLFGATVAQAQTGEAPVGGSVEISSTEPAAFDKLVVTWTAGADTDDNTIGYRVYWMKGATAISETTIQNAESMNVGINRADNDAGDPAPYKTQTFTVTGLDGGSMYQAGVASRGSDGVAAAGTAVFSSSAAETEDAPSPSTPRNITAMGGDETFTVMWDAPFAGHASLEIEEYRVQKREVAGSLTGEWVPDTGDDAGGKKVDGDMTMITFKDLDNGITYEGRVRAKNDAGQWSGWTTRDGDDPDDDATAMVGDDEDDEDDPMETPALPIAGILALGAGLVAAGRRRLRQ